MQLHVALCLKFHDGTLVGIDKNTSAIAVDVTRCHASVAMGTVDLVRELQKFADCLGLVTSMPVPLVIARLASSNLKLGLVDPDHDGRLLLEHHRTSGQLESISVLFTKDFSQLFNIWEFSRARTRRSSRYRISASISICVHSAVEVASSAR